MNKNLKKLIKKSYTLTPQSKDYETLAIMLTDYNFEKSKVCIRYQSVNPEQLPKTFTDLNCRRAMMDFLISKYKLNIIKKAGMELSDISDDQDDAINKLYAQVEDFIIENLCKILDLSIVKKEENDEEITK